jgi:hypothetical protein
MQLRTNGDSTAVLTAPWLMVPFVWGMTPYRIFKQGCVHNIPVKGATNPIPIHILKKLRRKGTKRASPTWARPMTRQNMTHRVLCSIQNLGNAARTECQTTNLTSRDAQTMPRVTSNNTLPVFSGTFSHIPAM